MDESPLGTKRSPATLIGSREVFVIEKAGARCVVHKEKPDALHGCIGPREVEAAGFEPATF